MTGRTLADDHRDVRTRKRRPAPLWVASGGLVLASAGLLLAASLQRWVVAGDAWIRTDSTVEDHRYDYSFPSDPWENVAAAAQLHGLGMMLLAVGVLSAGRAAGAQLAAGRPERQRSPLELASVILVAAVFGLTGLHALLSGLLGVPSPLQFLGLGLVGGCVTALGLVVLAVVWIRRSWPGALACLALLGVTLPGTMVITFQIAPMVAGYQSYDTTPWTESIVSAFVAVAALLLFVAGGAPSPRGADELSGI